MEKWSIIFPMCFGKKYKLLKYSQSLLHGVGNWSPMECEWKQAIKGKRTWLLPFGKGWQVWRGFYHCDPRSTKHSGNLSRDREGQFLGLGDRTLLESCILSADMWHELTVGKEIWKWWTGEGEGRDWSVIICACLDYVMIVVMMDSFICIVLCSLGNTL